MPKPLDQINQEFITGYAEKTDISFADTDPRGLPTWYLERYMEKSYPAIPARDLDEPRKYDKKLHNRHKPRQRHKAKKHAKPAAHNFHASSILIFLSIIIYLMSASIYYNQRNGARFIAGYALLPQLTDNMQPEIPKGSLLIVKSVGPETLKPNDIIIVSMSPAVYVTQKIESVYKNTDDVSRQQFITARPNVGSDASDSIDAQRIIGRVEFSVPAAGVVMSFIAGNLLLAGIVFICLVFVLSRGKRFFTAKEKNIRRRNRDYRRG